MIKQESLDFGEIKLKLLVDTNEKCFTIFNVFDTNKKGNARATFTFYKSSKPDVCKKVAMAIFSATERAEEIIKNENKPK